MKKLMLAAALLTLFALPALAAERCDNCRMKVREDSKYAVTLTMKDGGKKIECSLYCASMEAGRAGDDLAGMTVADYGTGEEVPARDASWVEGSDARAVMGDVSRVAFKDRADAEAYAAEHGGRVVSYDDALAGAASEWKRR